MKYIKAYKIFESAPIHHSLEKDKEVYTNIMDIIEDIQDMSYGNTTVRQVLSGVFVDYNIDYITVGFNFSLENKYHFSDIKHIVSHLISYVLSEGYSDYLYVEQHGFNDDDLIKNILPNDDIFIRNVRIYFYKA